MCVCVCAHKNGDIKETLVKAMEMGSMLIISNVCTSEICKNLSLWDVLQCRKQILRASHPVKVMVKDLN